MLIPRSSVVLVGRKRLMGLRGKCSTNRWVHLLNLQTQNQQNNASQNNRFHNFDNHP
jgi:hypothetical protein